VEADEEAVRERQEIEADLTALGYVTEDVRDAPDRPGREFVFVARRPVRGRPVSDR
jgi:hypothetical protein